MWNVRVRALSRRLQAHAIEWGRWLTGRGRLWATPIHRHGGPIGPGGDAEVHSDVAGAGHLHIHSLTKRIVCGDRQLGRDAGRGEVEPVHLDWTVHGHYNGLAVAASHDSVLHKLGPPFVKIGRAATIVGLKTISGTCVCV